MIPKENSVAIPVLIGPFPPPLHGASTINAKLAGAFAKRGHAFECIDLSPGHWRRDAAYHFTRLGRAIGGLWCILAAKGGRRYVMSLDGGWGLLYNIVLAAGVRLKSQKILFYHHSSNYVLGTSELMRLLLRVAGSTAPHVFCSEQMAALFRTRYGVTGPLLIVSNAAWVEAPAVVERIAGQRKRLGFLSNLLSEKGYGRAIDTLREAHRRGLDVELEMVGALAEPEAGAAVDAARREFGSRFVYRGALPIDEKADFYNSLYVFLFPSLYAHETQSLVVPEALAAGTPVIAYDHRFVGEILGEGGFLIGAGDDFAARAVEWLCDAEMPAWRRRAQDQFEKERRVALGQVDRLMAWALGD